MKFSTNWAWDEILSNPNTKLPHKFVQTWALHSICGVKGASIFYISRALPSVKWASSPPESPGDTPTPWVCHGTSNAVEAIKIIKKLSEDVWLFSSIVMLLFIKNWAQSLEDCITCSLKFFHILTSVFGSRRWKTISIDEHEHD